MGDYVYIVIMFENLPAKEYDPLLRSINKEELPEYERTGYYTSYKKAKAHLEKNYMSVDDHSYRYALVKRHTADTFYGYNDYQKWFEFNQGENSFKEIDFESDVIRYVIL